MLTIQSGHNLAHVMTAELSWHVQNCDLMLLWFFMLTQTYLQYNFMYIDHKSLMKWEQGLYQHKYLISSECKFVPQRENISDTIFPQYKFP